MPTLLPHALARTPAHPPPAPGVPRARTAAPARTAPQPGEPIALALAIHPASAGRPWHAALVTADGQQHSFDALHDLVQFLVALSLNSPPEPGLR